MTAESVDCSPEFRRSHTAGRRVRLPHDPEQDHAGDLRASVGIPALLPRDRVLRRTVILARRARIDELQRIATAYAASECTDLTAPGRRGRRLALQALVAGSSLRAEVLVLGVRASCTRDCDQENDKEVLFHIG